MPISKLAGIQTALKRLNYKVIWKWELDVMPGKPDNVFISPWLPQRDLLCKWRLVMTMILDLKLRTTEIVFQVTQMCDYSGHMVGIWVSSLCRPEEKSLNVLPFTVTYRFNRIGLVRSPWFVLLYHMGFE